MNLEKLQFIALTLEIFGLSLAIIDTFNKSLSIKIDSLIRLVNERLGTFDIFFTLDAVDYADDITADEADNIGFRRFFFFITTTISFWMLVLFFPTGDSSIGVFFYAVFQSLLVYLSIRLIVILLLINILVGIIDFFGQKNFLAGVGFLIALIGVGINSFQVFVSTYLWEGVTVWALVLVIIYIYLKERNG